MQNKIFFVKDIEKVKIGVEKPLIVYSSFHTPPKIDNAEYIEFIKYKTRYQAFNHNNIIYVGLNRIITPSNRCDMIFEYMSNFTPNKNKYSIDSVPFIGEPWRLFWHYLFTECNRFQVNYSYAIETEWQKWFYREQSDCRLSASNLDLFIISTYSDLSLLTTTFQFRQVTESDLKNYEQIKEHIFKMYNSPKLLINNVLKMANAHYNIDVSFDSYLNNLNYTLPDLKIYRFAVEENERRKAIYNKVISYESI
jgi:hypothetical protein